MTDQRTQLAALLAARAASQVRSDLSSLSEAGAAPPLVCVLGGGGGLPAYRQLAAYLPPRQVLALQLAGAQADDPLIRSIPQMARVHFATLQAAGLTGPLAFCGHSVAAMVALELARLWLEAGHEAPLVVLLDQPGPDVHLRKRDWARWQWSAVTHLPWRQRVAYVANGARFRLGSSRKLPASVRRWFKVRRHNAAAFAGDRLAAAEYRRRMTDGTLEAIRNYRPAAFPRQLALVRAESGSPRIHADAWGGWREVAAGGLEVREIHGHHMNLFEEPHVRELGEVVGELLGSVAL